MNMNFTWKQAETLSPGQLAIQGVELATKTWMEFAKFVLVAALGGVGVLIIVSILAGVLKGFGGFLGFILMALYVLAVGVGAIRLSLAVVDGKKLTINEMFKFDGKLIGSLIVAYIVFLFAIFIGGLVLVVPGIMIAYGCAFGFFVLVDKKDVGPIKALKASWAMSNGDLLSIALLASAMYLIAAVVVLPAYEVGILLMIFASILKGIGLGALAFIPLLLEVVLGLIVVCAMLLVWIGGCLSYALAYRKLSQTRSSAMEAAMKE